MDHYVQPVHIAGNPKGQDWTPDAIDLLGKMSDQAVAVKLGRPHGQVYKKRTALGIPALQKRDPMYKWAQESIALLGTAPDPAIAKQLGISAVVVRVKRRSLKIPRFPDPTSASAVIPQHLVDQFNKLTDGEIARVTGYSRPTISKHRRNMGIATSRVQGTLPEEANGLLGSTTDTELAKRYGVSRQCVSKRRLALGIARVSGPERPPITAEIIAKFGTRSDKDIAAEYGLTISEVRRARNNLGIPAFSVLAKLPEEAVALLGTQSDATIAARFGVSASTIQNARNKLGIKASRPKRAKTSGATGEQ